MLVNSLLCWRFVSDVVDDLPKFMSRFFNSAYTSFTFASSAEMKSMVESGRIEVAIASYMKSRTHGSIGLQSSLNLMSTACFVLWFIAILQIVDALQFLYFLTVDQICFDNGSNSSFMLDGCNVVIGVTIVVGMC